MISYTDGKYAEMWNQYTIASIDNEILIEALHKGNKRTFSILHLPNRNYQLTSGMMDFIYGKQVTILMKYQKDS